MGIFLSILKVLGIILGILLAVLLVLILLTLFLPFCYGVRADIRGKNEVLVKGKVSWMFSLVQIKLLAEGRDIRVWLSILGWKKSFYPKPEKEPEFEEAADRGEADVSAKEETEISIQTAELRPMEEDPDHSVQEKKIEKEADFGEEIPKPKSRKSLQKYLPWNMMKAWIAKFKRFLFSLKEKLDNIKKELSDENNKNAVSHIWLELKRLLRHIGPRRGKADLRYCMGDPAYTGQLTGLLSVMPLFYKKGVDVIPDFASDQFYVRGSFQFHGHMQVFPMLGIAFRVYKDKNIMNLIQKFK